MAPADLGSRAEASATVAMFQGYNRVLARPLSTAISGDTKRDGGSSESNCFVSLTCEELAKALHLDTTLSAGLGRSHSFGGKRGCMNHSTAPPTAFP